MAKVRRQKRSRTSRAATFAAVDAEVAPVRAAVAAIAGELEAMRSRAKARAEAVWCERWAMLRMLECVAALAQTLPRTDPRRADCIELTCDALIGASRRAGYRALVGEA